MTREIEVALTEEFETTMAARPEDGAVGDANGEPAVIDLAEVREGEAVRAAVGRAADVEAALGTAKIQHATRERRAIVGLATDRQFQSAGTGIQLGMANLAGHACVP